MFIAIHLPQSQSGTGEAQSISICRIPDISAQFTHTPPGFRQSRHAFTQLREQIALERTLCLDPRLHVDLFDAASIVTSLIRIQKARATGLTAG